MITLSSVEKNVDKSKELKQSFFKKNKSAIIAVGALVVGTGGWILYRKYMKPKTFSSPSGGLTGEVNFG